MREDRKTRVGKKRRHERENEIHKGRNLKVKKGNKAHNQGMREHRGVGKLTAGFRVCQI